jgi:probable HAF family extracellular repeat protein
MKRTIGIIGTFAALLLTASWGYGQAQQVANVTLTFAAQSFQPVSVNDNQSIVGNYITVSGGTQTTTGFLNVPGSPTQPLKFSDSDNYTRANGINNAGEVVGDFLGSDGVFHGYTYQDGSFSDPINLPGFNEKTKKFSTSLFGVSNNGTWAGAANPNGFVEGFVQTGNATNIFHGPNNAITYAYAVNTAGTAVGQYFDSNNLSHGFMWTASGGVKEVPYPGATQTTCTGINDFGTIVGTYTMASGQSGGFEVVNGNFLPLDLIVVGISSKGYMAGAYTVPGGAIEGFLLSPLGPDQGTSDTITASSTASSTSVYGVDVSGNLVGSYIDSTGVSHGMLLTAKGQLTPIDYPPPAEPETTVCYAINGLDDIVCNYADSAGNDQGAIYNAEKKTWTSIVVPGATVVLAYATNKLGHLAGTYVDSAGNQYGFLLTGPTGNFTQLRAPNSTFTVATGINSKGEVVAWWGDINNYIHSSSYLKNTWAGENLPGATNVFIGGIDDNSDLSYTWVDSVGNTHGGFYNATTAQYYLFDFPDFTGTESFGMNYNTLTSKAEIVGQYNQSESTAGFNGFTYTFQPKPLD